MALLVEIGIIILLILVNGFLAMAEFAIVSSKKSRIIQHKKTDSRGVQAALALCDDPNSFLSAIQIGITLIGILAGAYGGASIAATISPWLAEIFPPFEPVSNTLSLLLIVAIITYFTIILGELVPKRLGMIAPERIAIAVSYPVLIFAKLTRPITEIISVSTDFVLSLLRVNGRNDSAITEEEISYLMEEGVSAGIFEKSEKQMIDKVFDFTDRTIGSIMQPRPDIVGLNLDDSIDEIIKRIEETSYSRYPVYQTDLDTTVGILEVRDLISSARITKGLLMEKIRKPLFVPNTITSRALLEMFKQERASIALIIEEYGTICGLITVHDLTEEIFGTMPKENETDPDIVARNANSWLISATLPLHELDEALDIQLDQDTEHKEYRTVSGFILAALGSLPKTGDTLKTPKYHIEIVDMDDHRIDKIILTRREDLVDKKT
ncbi:MAG: hemolysin family protein [Methanomicrobiales archaeon]|jgi:putative hemolysin|nr:hemolysin family protein [Methanomicrobiales archaeon]